MNILDKRATNPAAALNGTELVYVAQLGADAVTTVQDMQTFITNGLASKDTVLIPNSTDPFPLTTKTLYIIGDYFTTTYGDLYLQLPPLTASTIIEVQLSLNIEEVGHVYLIPSGTDLVFGLNSPVNIKYSYLNLAPDCTVKLFFHSVMVGWGGQANFSANFSEPKIHPRNATSWAAGHRIISQSTGDCEVVIPDGGIHLGYPITYLAFDRSTDVLTGTRVDGLEVTTLLDQDHMDELLNPDGGFVGVPLLVGRTYRPAGSVAIYSPDTPVYLPAATVDAFNSHESVPTKLITGNSIINAGYLHLTPQVGETMYHSAINGSVFTSTYLPIPNNSEVTCYMIGVGKWYVDIRQDSNYLDTDHFSIVDPTDRTKSVKLNVVPVTAGTQKVITVPDANVNLGKLTNSTVAPSDITVTASPFTYQNTTAFNGDVIISGGTVSDIEFTRDNTTFYTVGFIEGVLRLSPSDRVRVTYTVAPTMTYVPR